MHAPAAFASNSGITYHGRILKPDGTPLSDSAVQFKIQLLTPGNESCVMYEELQTLNTLNTGGVFSITINDGTGTRTDSTGLTIDEVFQNRGSFTLTTCATGGSGPTAWAPNGSDGRKIQVSFRSSTMAQWEQLPVANVNFTPMAIESKQIGGFRPANLLRVDDTAAASNTTPLTSTQLNSFTSLINGTSTQYVQNNGSSGAVMPTFSGSPSTLAAGSMWFDTSSNQLKYYNGTTVMAVGASGGGSGTVTGITVGTGLVDGTGATGTVITTSGTIALPNVGAIGSYYKVTTDAQGRVASGAAALVESDIPTLTTAGHVSGSAITSGTIGGTTAVSTSGNLQTSGDITGKRIFVQDSGTNYAGFKAPTNVSTTYSLVLPTGLPASNGMVLSSDTLGNLTWSAAGSGSVSSVSGTAPISIGGTASAPVVGISQANTTTDGYLSKTDWNAFNSKLGNTLASGNIWIGNGSNVATAVTPSGDVTVTTSGGFKVTQIQGIAVSATAPTTAGQVLRYDGTSSYVPAQLSTSDISGLATALGNKIDVSQMPTNCAANQTLTFSSPSGAWTCSSIAITGSAFGSQAANAVLAAPSGSAGNPSFRTLVAADIPALDASKITTGTLAVAQGGTGTANGSITGTGALAFTAGGTNQNVTLNPSGTGSTVLGGNVGIGTTTPTVSLDLGARTDALALPKGPTQPSSPAAGWVRYNTTSNLIEFYNGTVWTSLSTGSGITALTGDVTASGSGSVAATVARVNGVTYPASPATNTVPVVTASGTVTYEAVPVAAGGTGLTSVATNSLLYGNGTGNMNALAPVNSAVLTSTSGGVPQWSTIASDTFTQYALLAGRAGGQALSGGTAASENLTLDSTANVTKGNILLASAGGNVGIGTTTPGARLEVSSGTANVSGLKFTNFNSSSPTTAGQPIGVDASGNLITVSVSGSGTVNSGSTNQLAWYNANGTAVSGLASAASSVLLTNASSVPAWSAISNDSFTQYTLLAGRSGGQTLYGGTAASDKITIDSTSNATKGNIILAPSGGNVGIGTTSPGAKLELSSGTANVSGLKFTNFSSASPTTAGQPVGVDASGNLVTIAVSGSGTVNSGTANQMAFYSASGSAVSGDANVTVSNGVLTLGQAGSVIGGLNLSGNTSGSVSINPQAAAGTYNFNLPTAAGTSGQVLTSGGGVAAPMTWTTLATSAITDTTNASNISSGTLNIARLPTVTVPYGGTGLTSIATNSLLYGNGTGNMNALAPVNSAVLTTTSGGVPQWSLLTADSFMQYALLAGRSGGQSLSGGTAASNNLTLDSTTSATKGYVLLAPSGGNVGIGTTSPGHALEVAGDISSSGMNAGVYIGDRNNTGNSSIYRSSNKTHFYDNTLADQMVLDNSTGSLGIGSASPNARLHVLDGSGWTNHMLITNNDFVNGTAGSGLSITNGLSSGNTYSALQAFGAGNTNQQSLILNGSGGNVGIGTTSPAAMLEIGGSNASTGVAFIIDPTLAVSSAAQYGMSLQPTYQPTGVSINDIYNITSIPKADSSATNITTIIGELARIDSTAAYTGSVTNGYNFYAAGLNWSSSTPIQNFANYTSAGIANGNGVTTGTITNTQVRLSGITAAAGSGGTVNNYGVWVTQPAGNTSGTSNYGLYINGNGGASATNNYSIYNSSTASSYFAGNVGIGTTSPASKLDVNGSIKVGADATTCSAAIQGAIHLNGTAMEYCNGSAWTSMSAAGSYLAQSGGTVSGALTVSGGTFTASSGASISSGLNNNSGGITNAGSITGVGANITGSGAVTVAAGGTAQNLTLGGSSGGGNVIINPNVGIGTSTPGTGTALNVAGQIKTGSFSITTGAVDWSQGNAGTTTFNCGSNITFANLRDGGSYTLVVTDAGTTQCSFSTTTTGDDAATVTYRFNPTNTTRTASSHTIYSLMRVGTIVYVSWITGF